MHDDDSVGAHLLRAARPVQRLMEQVGHLQQLTACVRQWAPASLAASLLVAADDERCIVIHLTSAAAMTELRFRESELRDHLRGLLGRPALRLVLRVRPATPTGEATGV